MPAPETGDDTTDKQQENEVEGQGTKDIVEAEELLTMELIRPSGSVDTKTIAEENETFAATFVELDAE